MVAAVIVPSLQELLSAAIQSYLYHRKIYPESVFESRYFSGIQVFLSREDALTEYIASHLLLRAETAGSLEKEASEFVAKFVVVSCGFFGWFESESIGYLHGVYFLNIRTDLMEAFRM